VQHIQGHHVHEGKHRQVGGHVPVPVEGQHLGHRCHVGRGPPVRHLLHGAEDVTVGEGAEGGLRQHLGHVGKGAGVEEDGAEHVFLGQLPAHLVSVHPVCSCASSASSSRCSRDVSRTRVAP